MDFFEVVEKRQSVRKYAAQPIEPEKLNAILQAANRAPSAGNFQSYEIYVVKGTAQQKALTAATFNQDFVAQAPLSLVFCMNPSRCQYSPPETFALEDTTIACTFAMLAATALGLSSCWIGAFDPRSVARVIECPAGVVPVAILPIAYPDEQPERTTRRELSDLVHLRSVYQLPGGNHHPGQSLSFR
jgi:FMN reductase [NAD(P)H]